jgi:hypothetical protein
MTLPIDSCKNKINFIKADEHFKIPQIGGGIIFNRVNLIWYNIFIGVNSTM